MVIQNRVRMVGVISDYELFKAFVNIESICKFEKKNSLKTSLAHVRNMI